MGSAISTLHKKKEVRAGHTPDWPVSEGAFAIEGELYHICPLSASKNNINFTSFPGKCSGTLFSMMFWLGKAGYDIFKIDDAMEVSPLDAKYYQITIQQKQALERQIKEGLAGISSAISDFELLFHDLRQYKDFLDYFRDRDLAIRTDNDELKEKTEQSLKSIFIDQVDVHTGEGVALKLIAPRWPTIISDFMKLDDVDVSPEKISNKYRVSEAEGVVLATKNKLYQEWRDSFEKVVKERYNRILSQVKARKFSIDEYKKMLKPYVERYQSIHEATRERSGRSKLRQLSWLKPGAQASSFDWSTIWAFKTLGRAEPDRLSYEAPSGKENILKIPFCSSFKNVIKKNIDYLKNEGLGELKLSSTGIEPFDKWVWALYKYIEDYYTDKYGFTIRFSLKELLDIRNDFISGWGGEVEPYYKCFDIGVDRVIIRLPDGTELEDMTFDPLYCFFETQNMMLLRLIEVKAKDKAMERYLDEMIGDTTKNKKMDELVEEYEKLFGEYGSNSTLEKDYGVASGQYLRNEREKAQSQVMKEVTQMSKPYKIIKKGDYEPRFDDVITGPYFTDVGGTNVKLWNFLKAKFDVPGFGIKGLK